MSIAKLVQAVEPDGVNWMDIVDEDGQIHHYTREGMVPDGKQVHVSMQLDGRVVLTRTQDGKPLFESGRAWLADRDLGSLHGNPARAPFPVVSAWKSTQKFMLTKTE